MATNFPTSIDSFTNPTSGDTLDSPSHAAQHANINDAMVAVQTKLGVGSGTIGTWTTYTPAWTSTGTNPAIGNGILQGRYTQINKLVVANIYMEFGSTTTAGTGTYYWGLPVASGSLFNGRFNGAFGYASIRDAGIATYRAFAELNPADTNNTNVRAIRSDNNSAVTNTAPFTWGTGDHISLTYIYQAA